MNETSATPDRPAQFYRMWHQTTNDWCHAFDVEAAAYRSWKEGDGPLRPLSVYMPDGSRPRPGTQVACGTCRSTKLRPPEMRTEFMRS